MIGQLKRAKRESMYGESRIAVIALALRFLDSDQTLSRLILLNRECYQKLSKPVFKQALLYS